ncbi:MAG: hypothetical protein IKI76_07225 [Selenomonadaceae bacterium]|nr:hypothetical protein [Selenomonadaceae bacterium]
MSSSPQGKFKAKPLKSLRAVENLAGVWYTAKNFLEATLKDFLRHELDELKQNKVRAIALGVCFAVLLIFWATDDSSGGEEIILEDEPPLTKDLPVKVLPVEKSPDGVTLVLGANADELFIGDPFAGEERPKPPSKINPPPLVTSALIQPPPVAQTKQPKERIILTGTAISGEVKTAMFLRDKETLFLTVGEEIGGKKISDISAEFVTFEDGQRVYLQKELR